MNISPAILGFLRGAGIAALIGVLGYVGDASHLNGVLSYSIASVIAALAAAWEHSIDANGGGALFGFVR